MIPNEDIKNDASLLNYNNLFISLFSTNDLLIIILSLISNVSYSDLSIIVSDQSIHPSICNSIDLFLWTNLSFWYSICKCSRPFLIYILFKL